MTATVDYSYSSGSISPEMIVAYPAVGAERYLGTDGRCLTGQERDELLAGGVGIGLIWETAADRSLDGYDAGRNDCGSANGYADRLDAPVVSIWYATDFHAMPDQINGPITEYYRGVRDGGGRPPRVYGGAPVIDRMCAALGYGSGWQAAAASWSDYRLSPNACLLQEVQQIWGNAADTNVVLCPDEHIDWLWGRSGGDWFDMATEEELRKIVRDELNASSSHLYVGSRPLYVPPDGRVFELVMVEGRRYRRWITSPDEVEALQWIDQIAGAPQVDGARAVTDPRYAAVLNAIPWLDGEPAGDLAGV